MPGPRYEVESYHLLAPIISGIILFVEEPIGRVFRRLFVIVFYSFALRRHDELNLASAVN